MNIKKTISIVLVSCSATFLNAQTEGVSIAPSVVPPDPSAMLDVQATDKGILIPRVKLDYVGDNLTPVSNPTNGLMVYNETGYEAKGYYYWDSDRAEWIRIGESFWEKEIIQNGGNPFSSLSRIYYSHPGYNGGEVEISNTGLNPNGTGSNYSASYLSQVSDLIGPTDATIPIVFQQRYKTGSLGMSISSEANSGTISYGSLNTPSSSIGFVCGSVLSMEINPGSVIIPVGSGFLNLSDSILKENIVVLKNATSKIIQLKGVTYNWKDKAHNEKKQYGVIAQNVEKVFPELVDTNQKGIKAVNYIGLIAPLIEATKEQQLIIEVQKIKINSLEKQLNSFEQRIQKLESQ